MAEDPLTSAGEGAATEASFRPSFLAFLGPLLASFTCKFPSFREGTEIHHEELFAGHAFYSES